MKYYAHINSKNILIAIDMSILSKDEYGSSNVQNVEVDETFYNTAKEKGIEYFIYQDGEIIENSEYENILTKKEQLQQIEEIKDQLNQLDLKSIRAIRANETEYLEEYEMQAQSLRSQLAKITV